MNIVHLRETLRPICEKLWPRRKVAEAPVFVWESHDRALQALLASDRDEISELIYSDEYVATLRKVNSGSDPYAQHVENPICRLPFPAFIIYMPANPKREGTPWREEVIVVVESPTVLNPDMLRLFPDGESVAEATTAFRPAGSIATTYSHRYFNQQNAEEYLGVARHECLCGTFAEFSELMAACFPDTRVEPFESLNWIPAKRALMAQRLRPFIYEVFFPANHVVTSRPVTPGKSVEWVKARTHYVVMDRRSMSHVTRAGVAISRAEQAEHIKRAAHARKAHVRILKHSRYGANIGKMIRIGWAWVGPKEWIGTDGKVYVLMADKPGLKAA